MRKNNIFYKIDVKKLLSESDNVLIGLSFIQSSIFLSKTLFYFSSFQSSKVKLQKILLHYLSKRCILKVKNALPNLPQLHPLTLWGLPCGALTLKVTNPVGPLIMWPLLV